MWGLFFPRLHDLPFVVLRSRHEPASWVWQKKRCRRKNTWWLAVALLFSGTVPGMHRKPKADVHCLRSLVQEPTDEGVEKAAAA